MKTKKTSKKSWSTQICFRNGNSCIKMLQYLLFWYLTINIFLFLDFVTWKVVLLAQNFLKIDSCITKVLRSCFFHYQAFMALPTEIWSINEYVRNCKQNEVVGESDLSCILNAILQILHMMLESIPLSVSYKSGLCLLLDSEHGEKLES